MFKATYHIIKDQFSSLYTERCTYAKIFLAPLTSYIVFTLILELLGIINVRTTSYSTHMNIELAIILTSLIFLPLITIYALKGLVQTIRFVVLKELPTTYFGIYLFKQSYLMTVYFFFFPWSIAFASMSSNIVISFLFIMYYLYSLTWYPYNLISAAADVSVDFFRVALQIGKWAVMNLLILIVFSILYIATILLYRDIPLSIMLFLTYFLILNQLGCYGRSYLSCDNIHK